jgi:hypothetical protein
VSPTTGGGGSGGAAVRSDMSIFVSLVGTVLTFFAVTQQ